jgi:hypothetical protein
MKLITERKKQLFVTFSLSTRTKEIKKRSFILFKIKLNGNLNYIYIYTYK